MMVCVLLLFALVLWLVTYKISRQNMYKLASLLPAPVEELPIIGIARTLMGSNVGKFLYLLIVTTRGIENLFFQLNEKSKTAP